MKFKELDYVAILIRKNNALPGDTGTIVHLLPKSKMYMIEMKKDNSLLIFEEKDLTVSDKSYIMIT